ncbi:phage major tail tube protein [Escherichia coli]|uniref:phage major tail tube protein n=1 Tax=Escherichia coli TaxID=562 RepID=UPI00191B17E5|nr:phage major tail tube protein [Escherichia coli]CAD6040195.1 major tail tube protein [Escherichia coli]CAD6090054.1 major tail tube protein [Escherichia coli]CAD6121868.1 major tail tube protein [Escherichia coli]
MKNNLRGWTLFINGVSRIDGAHEYTPPELSVSKIDIRTGAMDTSIPVDDGMEAMTASFKIYGVDPAVLALFGMQAGILSPRITAYEAYTNTGAWNGKVDELQGLITKITPDARPDSNKGEAGYTVELSLNYYRSTYNGVEIYEIIPEQCVRRVNGVNVLEGMKTLLRV